jgi:hypothetical protein
MRDSGPIGSLLEPKEALNFNLMAGQNKNYQLDNVPAKGGGNFKHMIAQVGYVQRQTCNC